MNCKLFVFCSFLTFLAGNLVAQKAKSYRVSSPNQKITVTIEIGPQLLWTVDYGDQKIISPSSAALFLEDGKVLGKNMIVTKAKVEKINTSFTVPYYKKKLVPDVYDQLTIDCKGGYSFQVRAYDEGAAYRFLTHYPGEITVQSETAGFRFEKDDTVLAPYVCDLRLKGDPFQTSFESSYTRQPISRMYADSLTFLPLLVNLEGGLKAVILEAGLEGYPGMYLVKGEGLDLKARFAAYPAQQHPGGISMFNSIVIKRAPYLAKVSGDHSFPWRAVVISRADKDLANSDMTQKLSAPCQIGDVSWIQPGKVSWDWWNDWNISHVDFRAGLNNQTYKYYIDFAAANGLEYIILDEGWSNATDLSQLNPGISVPELADYAKNKHVGLILWASWRALWPNLEQTFSQYEKLGIKGFKIDFLDRDDAEMTASTYAIARKAAVHHLLVDFHGMYKPDGLSRTYPNVVNYEGVKGMENCKWSAVSDMPAYEVTLPFIRMVAGPMDYTPGAMRNAGKYDFHASGSLPMSQGTRAHQVAMYVVFEAPLQMLADNPTVYMKEQETTTFISAIPTVYDETIAMDGAVGKYIVLARKKGDTWYAGAMTNWDARELNLDFSFLPAGNYEAEIFRDGINADRDATDYKLEKIRFTPAEKIKIKLAPGGGWAAKINALH